MTKTGLVIFDLDGTLMDSSEGILEAVKYAISHTGLEMPSDEVLKSFIGPPIEKCLREGCGADDNAARLGAAAFREYYSSVSLLKAKPYPGIYEAMDALRSAGLKVAVATNKRESYASTLLKAYHFDEHTDIMHGTDLDGTLKKKDLIWMCMQECGVLDKERVWMVGDASSDFEAANASGVNFLGVSYGFSYKPDGDYPFPLAHTTDDIPSILMERIFITDRDSQW